MPQIIMDHGVSGCFGTTLAPNKMESEMLPQTRAEAGVFPMGCTVDTSTPTYHGKCLVLYSANRYYAFTHEPIYFS
jgi:hypothetical protein